MFPLLCLLLFLAALCGEAIRRHRCYRDGKTGGIPVWFSPVCMIPGIVLLALLWFVTRLAGRSFAAEVRKR